MWWKHNSIYIVFIGVAGGVLLGTRLDFIYQNIFITASIVFLCGLLSRKCTGKSATYVRAVGLLLLCVLFGWWRIDTTAENVFTTTLVGLEEEEVVLEGVIIRDPEIRPNSLHIHVRTEDTKVLAIVDRHFDVVYGTEVRLEGRLRTPEPFAAELGRYFPYDGFLAAKGITHTLFYPEVTTIATNQGHPFYTLLLTNKNTFIEYIERKIPEPQVGLAEGLLLGIKRAMSDDTLAAFRTTGIIHIVVLSGYNVMLVVAFVQYVLGIFFPLKVRIGISLVAILCFALTVGLTATVVRASIMASLLLVAQYLGRSYEALRGLFLAGLLMIVINPYLLLYDIGFQLSFVATLGLILVAPHLEILFTTTPLTVRGRSYVIATIATQIAVTPLLLYQVGELSVISPLVNLLILPVVPIAMLSTFLTGISGLFFDSVASVFAYIAYLALSYILFIAITFAEVPLAAFWVPAFSFVWVIVGYIVLYYLYTTYATWQQNRQFGQVVTDGDLSEVADWRVYALDDIAVKYKKPG